MRGGGCVTRICAAARARLGKVHFENSCAPAVRADFDRAVALLHSFWFAASTAAFEGVAQKDASCAMAHWGVAMANWGNPLGGTRTPKTFELGLAAVAKARAAAPKTARERAYIDAVELLYKDSDKLDHPTRATKYEEAMAAIVAANPKDTEAPIFYAIALDAAAPPTDKTYAKQIKAAALLEKAFAAQPEHPGISHYLIHSYDVPAMANKGLPAARRYAGIAPDAPHALHMPSHIFTRVGAWEDSIKSNAASAASAAKANSPAESLHAMDYQVYAYLQLAKDTDARRIQAESEKVIAGVSIASAYGLAGYYAAAAIPARVALERSDWAAASKLAPMAGTFPATEAIAWFARAIGAARSGNAAEAAASAAKLPALRDGLKAKSDLYWADIVDIQWKVADGWAKYAAGQKDAGLALLRDAATQEDATEKSPISPGPLAPARELYAEMLLEAGRAAEALKEFEAVMKKEPGRYRSLAGAMNAADAAGDKTRARQFAMDLIKLAGTGTRPEIARAKALAK
jgi:hypothetical protein